MSLAKALYLAFGRRDRQPLRALAERLDDEGPRAPRDTVRAWRTRGWIETDEPGWVRLTTEGAAVVRGHQNPPRQGHCQGN